jgi:hypothetical protein
MNLTINYRNAHGAVSQAAAAAVIAAAVRVGHTATLIAGADTATFSLEDGGVVVTVEHADRTANDPAEWAGLIAATATQLIRHRHSSVYPQGRRWPGDNLPPPVASPVARRRGRRPLTGS